MLYEYAVEPRAIGKDWQSFRYLIEKFGFDKGRLISQFPKHWFREVYQAADGLSPIDKKRIEEGLRQAKGMKVFPFGRPYSTELGGWVANALAEHLRAPFHAIVIAATDGAAEYVLCVDDFDERHALMAVPTECSVPRDIDSLSKAFEGLLRFGSRVIFVDPFFDPFDTGQKRMFARCLNIIRDRNERASCEIHYRYHEDRFSNETLEGHAATLFRDIIPEGMAVTIYCWKEKDGGEDFHARYLLTEKGGIRVDAGFDPIGEHQHTDVTLMNLDLVQLRLASFSRASEDYELIEPVIEVQRDGTVKHV